jgi:glycerol-3-phosphate dehydrogenase (NAD(P)+)
MGSGSWGTAFALVLADAGNQVTLWARRPELAAVINAEHRNPDYFPTIELPTSVRALSDPAAAMADAEFVVLAVPSQSLRANLAGWTLPGDAVVVSLAKGIELGTGLRMSQVIADAAGVEPERIAVVTGPNLAREIAERQPSASVVASVSPATGRRRCSRPATPPGSAPTPTPTWSAASWVAPPRTSSPSRSASRSGSGWGPTPPPR